MLLWYVLPLLCHCPHTIPPLFLLPGMYFLPPKDLRSLLSSVMLLCTLQELRLPLGTACSWRCPHLSDQPCPWCSWCINGGIQPSAHPNRAPTPNYAGRAVRADGRGWGLLGEEGAEWPSRSRAERAVRRGATRCPYEKGLGAAHGRVTTETKLGLELGAPQPLSSSGCRDQPRGSRGPSPASLGDAAARGCAQAVLSQSSPLLINSKC